MPIEEEEEDDDDGDDDDDDGDINSILTVGNSLTMVRKVSRGT